MAKYSQPPQDITAEKAVLGSIMVRNEKLDEVASILEPEDFYREAHRQAYSVMLLMHQADSPIDIVTLTEALRKQGLLERVGGVMFVSDIANAVPTAANAQHYAKIVSDKSKLRQLIEAAQRIESLCFEESDEPESIAELAEDSLNGIYQEATEPEDGKLTRPLIDLLESINNAKQAREEGRTIEQVVPSGLNGLDHLLTGGGFRPGQLVILGARPAMGKTALALQLVEYAASQNKTAAFLSFEMGKKELLQRILAAKTGIDTNRQMRGQYSDNEASKLIVEADKINKLPMRIFDSLEPNVSAIRTCMRKVMAQEPLHLIVIDYMQLLSVDRGKRKENRQQEVTDISRSLKILARELGVPIVVLSQLSRSCEARNDKRPLLSDLRESGSLEQDADIVIFLYREGYYDHEIDERAAEIIIAKQRSGVVGTVNACFFPEQCCFADYE